MDKIGSGDTEGILEFLVGTAYAIFADHRDFGFAKPIVSGYATEENATSDLVEATTEGLWFHKIRVVWEALVEFAHRLPLKTSERELLNSKGHQLSLQTTPVRSMFVKGYLSPRGVGHGPGR